MLRRSLAALALAALLAPATRAQTAPAATPQAATPQAASLTVDQILAKHYEAQGGLDKIKKVQTMRFTGTMGVGPGMDAPFTLEKKRPGMQRMEFQFSGMTGIQAFDGKQGWSVMPFMGKKDPEPLSDEDAKEAADQADFDGPLVDWKDKGHTVELAGKESVDGADAYKLKVTKKGGQVEYYDLDAETFLLVKEEAKRSVRGTEMETESSFGDYKEVSGLMVPFTMTNGVKGTDHKQAMTFTKVEFDVPMDAAHFTMPAATAAAAPDSSAKPASPKSATAAKKSK